MEYGQIFHVMRIGKYYCKNMRYRINIFYSILHILTIVFHGTRTVEYHILTIVFHGTRTVEYQPIFHGVT